MNPNDYDDDDDDDGDDGDDHIGEDGEDGADVGGDVAPAEARLPEFKKRKLDDLQCVNLLLCVCVSCVRCLVT